MLKLNRRLESMLTGCKFFWLLLLSHVFWLSASPIAYAQQTLAQTPAVSIALGSTKFPVNEYFTISFTLHGAALNRYSAFPDIEGFKKSGKSSTTTTRIVGGTTTTELTITQRYAAYQEGEFELPPFTMTINGEVARSEGATLTVGPQQAAAVPPGRALQGLGLLDQLFGKKKPEQYVEPKDHAFMALLPDKTSVYVGEGLHVGLYFYLTPGDQGLLDFYNFAGQLPGIVQQLHQRTVWEEHFDDQEIMPETIVVGGKTYLRYQLYETELYPLNTEPLQFPAISLQMVKYRVAKDPGAAPDDRLEGYKTYFTDPRTIPVKPLPPHPQRDQVPVGNYALQEAVDSKAFRVGQAVTYSFEVEGEGNLAALAGPILTPQPGLETYGPDVQQELTRQGGRVGGRKRFTYRLLAQQPGPIHLDSLFSLVCFNPTTAHYDTLRSKLTLLAKGALAAPAFRPRPDDPFYGGLLTTADNTLQPLDAYRDVRRYTNMVLVVLLAAAGYGWWRGRK